MKQILVLICGVMLSLPTTGCNRAAKARDAENKARLAQARVAESQAFEGVWKPVNASLGGMALPRPALAGITLKIAEDKYEVTAQGEHGPDRGTSTIDPNTIPKRMSTTSTDGPNKGKTFLAIYEFQDANTLRVCYDLSGAAYPTEFKSTPGTQLYLVTYKRQ